MIESNDLTPQELHKADLIYKISEQRQLYDQDGYLLLNYENDKLLDKFPNIGFLCYNKINEKYSVLYNRGCMGILKKFDEILGYIMQQDDLGNDKLWFEMRAEPYSFIYKWYLGNLDEDIYIDEVNQERMYQYIRQYRVSLTEEEKLTKPKRTNDGMTIREKCEKAGVKYKNVLCYRSEHPDMTEDEVIQYYIQKRDKLQNDA